MELRPYQQRIINDARSLLRTYKSPVITLPCGGGKSVICAEISKIATTKGNAVLFLVHRIELVEQIQETFTRHGVDMKLCDIAMVQSAKKLTRDYKLIITDESHHNTCKTYTAVYDRYPNAHRINVTATPCRSDGTGLAETSDYLYQSVTAKWLIANSYLAPYEYYSVNLLKVTPKKVRGEYEDLTEMLDKAKVYGDVLKYYKQGQKAICYCSSLKHSENTADNFNNAGIPARHIDGKTPKEERKRIIDDFRSGAVKVLCNFSLLGEGFDVPDCDSVMILRKTTSLNLFVQMSMRGMRHKDGKTAYIYDFCGNCFEHGLPDDERQWTLDSTKKKGADKESDIKSRQCGGCFRAYGGQARYCPYCANDNGKTRKEIENDKAAELEAIKKVEKNELKIASKSLEGLQEYGRRKGYKPYWAIHRWEIIKNYKRN